MALVASEVQKVDPAIHPSGVKVKFCKFAFDAAYPAGGEAITHSELGCNRVLGIAQLSACAGYVPVLDVANQKIMAYYGDYSEAGDGPLIEAAAGDIGSPTFYALVVCV